MTCFIKLCRVVILYKLWLCIFYCMILFRVKIMNMYSRECKMNNTVKCDIFNKKLFKIVVYYPMSELNVKMIRNKCHLKTKVYAFNGMSEVVFNLSNSKGSLVQNAGVYSTPVFNICSIDQQQRLTVASFLIIQKNEEAYQWNDWRQLTALLGSGECRWHRSRFVAAQIIGYNNVL